MTAARARPGRGEPATISATYPGLHRMLGSRSSRSRVRRSRGPHPVAAGYRCRTSAQPHPRPRAAPCGAVPVRTGRGAGSLGGAGGPGPGAEPGPGATAPRRCPARGAEGGGGPGAWGGTGRGGRAGGGAAAAPRVPPAPRPPRTLPPFPFPSRSHSHHVRLPAPPRSRRRSEMASTFARAFPGRRSAGLLAMVGAGSLAAGFLLARDTVSAGDRQRRLYPPRYRARAAGAHVRGAAGGGRGPVLAEPGKARGCPQLRPGRGSRGCS